MVFSGLKITLKLNYELDNETLDITSIWISNCPTGSLDLHHQDLEQTNSVWGLRRTSQKPLTARHKDLQDKVCFEVIQPDLQTIIGRSLNTEGKGQISRDLLYRTACITRPAILGPVLWSILLTELLRLLLTVFRRLGERLQWPIPTDVQRWPTTRLQERSPYRWNMVNYRNSC